MQSDGFYPSRKIKTRGNEYWIALDLWPFFGILLVLLIILMVITGPPFASRRSHNSNLPVASHAVPLSRAVKDDAIYISVTGDGRLYFGSSRVLPAEVSGRMQESLKNGSEKRIYMVVDARAKYGDVKVVLDEIRSAKVEQVSFLVGKKVS